MGRRVAATLLCGALVLSACGNDASPTSSAADTVPDPGQEFAVTTSDGLNLEARIWGEGDQYVILAHMRPADMSSWFDFARELTENGYRAVAFNFRGYGESEGNEGEFSVAADVRAVVEAAEAAGAERIFLVGASMGGTGVVAASGSHDITATVALSAPDEFEGVSAVGVAPFVETPLLLIAADEDGTYADDAVAIASETKGETEVIVLSGGQHGTNMFAEHGAEITELILSFFSQS